ncbi:hypothetical protein TthAA37_13150 [Thermus thermophilus]|uniref:Uncharacterized protein n=1 Tax=Thermus thermophilus TaxID=274 RepID=A0AAD1KU67_THETH|nr:hypothetical protein [Thermus thermophilus]BBL82444.1 hypothetical protein TthAA220_12280 [Thermus thermophilus]BBL84745.1 hypothetical protein TthAA229_12260 [Thermus thermophilus]BCZ87104.1 hypothetical protein TthAA11_12860 [Thermus thermophilus]BCZ89477.1 hypothetical protein TthAA22_12820 [Thermus thermophilus]BCZ92126.1 hypothetical protein TthAA37_13150 [Thermus thermophilus]
MKRFLGLFVVLLGLGLAQSPGVGVYSGYPTYLGAQFQSDTLRFGVGLSYFGVAGDAALILQKNPLQSGELPMSWYYGAGLGAGIYWGGGFLVYPHGLAGVELRLPDPAINPYFEVQLGVSFANFSVFLPHFAGRLGVILR